jgi:hypothetical protein
MIRALTEIGGLKGGQDLAVWAARRLLHGGASPVLLKRSDVS